MTILNDGHPAKIAHKPPFSEYERLWGVDVVYGDPANPATFPAGDFEVRGGGMHRCARLCAR